MAPACAAVCVTIFISLTNVLESLIVSPELAVVDVSEFGTALYLLHCFGRPMCFRIALIVRDFPAFCEESVYLLSSENMFYND